MSGENISMLQSFSNDDNYTRTGIPEISDGKAIALGLFLGTCTVCTIVINFVTVYIFAEDPAVKEFDDYLLMNLATQDGLIGLIPMSIALYKVLEQGGTWTPWTCIIYQAIDVQLGK